MSYYDRQSYLLFIVVVFWCFFVFFCISSCCTVRYICYYEDRQLKKLMQYGMQLKMILFLEQTMGHIAPFMMIQRIFGVQICDKTKTAIESHQ